MAAVSRETTADIYQFLRGKIRLSYGNLCSDTDYSSEFAGEKKRSKMDGTANKMFFCSKMCSKDLSATAFLKFLN